MWLIKPHFPKSIMLFQNLKFWGSKIKKYPLKCKIYSLQRIFPVGVFIENTEDEKSSYMHHV